MLTQGLRDILAKQPVVNTKVAEQLFSEPHEVEHAYLEHYHTHVALGDTEDYAKRLIEKTQQAKTPKGAIVAPWGYGKTSTLIFVWKACEDKHLIAVPPFVCSSLQDILTATYGWLRFRLSGVLVDELTTVYNQFTRAAFDDHVRSVARETGVTEADVRATLQREKERGTPIGELTASSLLKFLEYAANLVTQKAGFGGLVILADEMQQLFDKTKDLRGTIQQLREMVLWLATHNSLPLSLILCLPDSTESVIQQPGQDILDRLKTDRLYLNLRDIYNTNFPTELWTRYADLYSLNDEASRVIHKYTLQAIGQIATRQDLGRGPRTVVDALQCGIRHYDKTGETYTPIDLIDDFMNSNMSFDSGQISNAGQVHTIRSAVDDVLALSTLIKSPEHRIAVKLWAAFPEHGCPDEILDFFGVRRAADEISHVGHGELLTYQTSGYTLRKLASFVPGGEIVERIARDFWRGYIEDDPLWAEAARNAFCHTVLPDIFEQKRDGWAKLNFSTNSAGGVGAQVEGTFSDLFPKRLVDIQVANNPNGVEKRTPKAISDLQFDFVLMRGNDDAYGKVEYVGGNTR